MRYIYIYIYTTYTNGVREFRNTALLHFHRRRILYTESVLRVSNRAQQSRELYYSVRATRRRRRARKNKHCSWLANSFDTVESEGSEIPLTRP